MTNEPLWKAYRSEADIPLRRSLGEPIAHRNKWDAEPIARELYAEPVIVAPFVTLRLPVPD